MATPYRNIDRDIQNEDINADRLQPGIDSARHGLDIGAQVMQRNPSLGNENSYNNTIKALIDKINAQEKIRSKARELEIQKLPPQESRFDRSDVQTQPSRDPSSLAALLQFAGGSASAEAATNPMTTNAPAFHAPMTAPQVPAQRAAQAVQTMRNSGLGQTGDKAIVDEKNTAKTTTTNPLLLDANDIETVGGAIRGTPEWQRQNKGLDDLEYLTGLEAQKNAKKFSADLSPLGAYLDYQNGLHGKPTNLEKGLHMAPLEDTSLKDMGEIQRRRADMAKELINTIKASKVGQIVTQDGQVVGYTGGIQMPRPINPSAGANLNLRRVQALTKETDSTFKENDEALKALNQAAERVATNNPSAIASLPLVLEKMDSGSTRMMAAAIGMELKGGDASWPAQLRQGLQTMSTGTLSPHAQQVFKERFKEAAVRAQQERDAKREHLNSYADALGSTPEERAQIVESHYKIPVKGYPTASGMGAGKNLSPEDEKAHMKMFLDMVNAHEAGK